MSEHTPGTWYTMGGTQPQIASESDPRGATLALVYDGEHSEANARLIAAAPDLLQVALMLVDVISYEQEDYPNIHFEELAAATAAIDKATLAPNQEE